MPQFPAGSGRAGPALGAGLRLLPWGIAPLLVGPRAGALADRIGRARAGRDRVAAAGRRSRPGSPLWPGRAADTRAPDRADDRHRYRAGALSSLRSPGRSPAACRPLTSARHRAAFQTPCASSAAHSGVAVLGVAFAARGSYASPRRVQPRVRHRRFGVAAGITLAGNRGRRVLAGPRQTAARRRPRRPRRLTLSAAGTPARHPAIADCARWLRTHGATRVRRGQTGNDIIKTSLRPRRGSAGLASCAHEADARFGACSSGGFLPGMGGLAALGRGHRVWQAWLPVSPSGAVPGASSRVAPGAAPTGLAGGRAGSGRLSHRPPGQGRRRTARRHDDPRGRPRRRRRSRSRAAPPLTAGNPDGHGNRPGRGPGGGHQPPGPRDRRRHGRPSCTFRRAVGRGRRRGRRHHVQLRALNPGHDHHGRHGHRADKQPPGGADGGGKGDAQRRREDRDPVHELRLAAAVAAARRAETSPSPTPTPATQQTSGSSVYGGGRPSLMRAASSRSSTPAFSGNSCFATGPRPRRRRGSGRSACTWASPVYITGDTFTGNSCSNGGAAQRPFRPVRTSSTA